MKPAVFLDRDGVINEVLTERVKFVNRPDDVYMLPRVGEAIHLINQAGYPVFIVTNQGGIGLGYMKEEALQKVHERISQELEAHDAYITDTAYCPHRPDAGCSCRKPETGMLDLLSEKHGIDLKQSYLAGDRAPDIEAGKKAGMKTILIGNNIVEADKSFPDLFGFAKWLTRA